MCYKNGKDVLPPDLLSQLQEYIQGEIIYIPKAEKTRAGWGEANGTRKLMKERNDEICRMYKGGHGLQELSSAYHLSEDSIRKILIKSNQNI